MSLFWQVQEQIRHSAGYLGDRFPERLLAHLLTHRNIIEANVTINMDDGTERTFQGWRCQHVDVKGPFKGGIRYHPQVSLDEVKSLSAWMSFKTAVVDLPLGWGKGWIIVDPKTLSRAELERLSRGYIQQIRKHIWPTKDVPAPDVNTNGMIMGWMVDEFATCTGQWQPGVITGKPLSIWGSKGRDIATSLGGMYVLEQFLWYTKESLAGKTIVIQWAGNAGLNFALLACEAGAIVTAISDSQGAIYKATWLDVKKIMEIKAQNKSVITCEGADVITEQELFALPCHVLVPAALESQITESNAPMVQAKVILELANGPTTPAADKILTSKDIIVLPDILANAGGVTVSYFEQVQNNTNYYRSKQEVFDRLHLIMCDATDALHGKVQQHTVSRRDAAYIVAIERLLQAMQDRGR